MEYKDYFEQKAKLFKDKADFTSEVRIMIVCKLFEIPIDHYSSFLDKYSELKSFLQITDKVPSITEEQIEALSNKADDGINIIMQDDYKKLIKLENYFCFKIRFKKIKPIDDIIQDNVNKDVVCSTIKKVLSSRKYRNLIDDDTLKDGVTSGRDVKEQIEFYSRLYFLPIEVVNPFVKKEYSDQMKYKEHLIMQWQTANEMAANISQQRSNMNNFYMSLLTILIAGTLFGDYFTESIELYIKIPLYICIMIIGISLCSIWRKQIENYKKLNYAKFLVINRIERELPANVMYYEYLKTDKNPQKDERRVSFSVHEKYITVLFEVFIIIVPMILIIGSLKGTGAWTWVKGLLPI